MEEHLNSGTIPQFRYYTYFLLKKNPTESLPRKLDDVLKKLLKEDKISKRFYDNNFPRCLYCMTDGIKGELQSL